jgi:uncharacterized protein (TIGR00299 family) protein
LTASTLAAPVREHALAMFALLARAEAAVHAVAVDDVVFHEVGAWDSIADFVAAAWLIDALGTPAWTWAPPPLGGGRVDTTHGVLPIPAPATALLLRGFELIDDGVPGERVTPTGAAILRHLAELGAARDGEGSPSGAHGAVLAATGTGFGTRRLPGVANVLRCLAFAEVEQRPGRMRDEQIASVQFEIDDQASEDLAVALERIRATPGVLEAYQTPMIAKKGRLATQVLVLARPQAVEAVSELCFAQTTTLGLRIAQVQRRVLARAQRRVRRDDADAAEVRVKVAIRPSGECTAKAEIDDLARAADNRAGRERLRRHVESRALEETGTDERRAATDD